MALTVVQPGVGGTGTTNAPAFSATGGVFAVTGNTTTKVQLTTEQFDTASCFNNTGSTVGSIPAYSFLPNVAGYYLLTMAASQQENATGVYMQIYVYKNGSQYAQLATMPATNVNYACGGGSIVVYLNGTTDYVAFYVNAYPNNTNVYLQSFTGCLLRAA